MSTLPQEPLHSAAGNDKAQNNMAANHPTPQQKLHAFFNLTLASVKNEFRWVEFPTRSITSQPMVVVDIAEPSLGLRILDASNDDDLGSQILLYSKVAHPNGE
jgi:hypothetical protein